MNEKTIKILENKLTIYRFKPKETIPPAVLDSKFYCIVRTEEELSIVCDSSIELAGGEKNGGWSCLEAAGPLDFSLSGVLSGISSVLAAASISIFVISTFNTDYILVKSAELENAVRALREAGYEVE
jgi:hypothetical protein